MGAFNITIKGFGPHHNRNQPGDANRVAQSLVHALKANGCDISLAEFQITGGDAEDLRAADYTKFDDLPQVVAVGQEGTTEGSAGADAPAAPAANEPAPPAAVGELEAPPVVGSGDLNPPAESTLREAPLDAGLATVSTLEEVPIDDGLAAPGT